MKILFVLTYYHPHWTGLTRYAQRLAEALADRGWGVSILTSKYDQKLTQHEVINKVDVFRLNYLLRLSRTLIQPRFFLAAIKHIANNDVVVCYLPYGEVLYVALVCRLLGKRLLLVHNGDLVLPKSHLKRILEWLYYSTTAAAIVLSDGVILQTEDYGRSSGLLSSLKNKWRVILPLYSTVFQRKKTDGRSQKQSYTVGFAGRFVEEKGFDYLLQAIPLVLKRIPRAHFCFAGEHQIVYEDFYQQNVGLVEQYKHNLTFIGLLKTEEAMADFYRSLDVFVISSRSDCFPSTQVEAILCGTPVVCTDIPGARWVVQTTGMGKIVKARNPQALADGIIEVLLHRGKYIQPLKKIEQIFNLQTTIKAYEQLFAENFKM